MLHNWVYIAHANEVIPPSRSKDQLIYLYSDYTNVSANDYGCDNSENYSTLNRHNQLLSLLFSQYTSDLCVAYDILLLEDQ